MSLVEHPIRRFQPTLVAFLCLVASGHLGGEPAMLQALRYCVAAAVGARD